MAIAKKMPLVWYLSKSGSIFVSCMRLVHVYEEHYHEEIRWSFQGYIPGDL
jgi:hypothetical protein